MSWKNKNFFLKILFIDLLTFCVYAPKGLLLAGGIILGEFRGEGLGKEGEGRRYTVNWL